MIQSDADNCMSWKWTVEGDSSPLICLKFSGFLVADSTAKIQYWDISETLLLVTVVHKTLCVPLKNCEQNLTQTGYCVFHISASPDCYMLLLSDSYTLLLIRWSQICKSWRKKKKKRKKEKPHIPLPSSSTYKRVCVCVLFLLVCIHQLEYPDT